MITKDQLIKTLPPIIYHPDGSVNCVLALRSDSFFGPTNTYFGKWTTSNSVHYNNNPDLYEGWIELEYIPTPVFD